MSSGSNGANGSQTLRWVIETERKWISFPCELANTPEEAIAVCHRAERLYDWEVDNAIAYIGEPGKPADLMKVNGE